MIFILRGLLKNKEKKQFSKMHYFAFTLRTLLKSKMYFGILVIFHFQYLGAVCSLIILGIISSLLISYSQLW